MKSFILAALLTIIASPLFAQINVESGFSTPELGEDTICFRYKFEPHDTLLYSIESADSVAIIGEPVLTKLRHEKLRVVCDSVSPVGVYHLRLTLLSAHEVHVVEGDSSTRTSSQWIGRTAYISIDSMGKRLSVAVDDDKRGALAPGGAFHPILFPTLGSACGVQNQSWMVEDTTLLVENGVPEPAFSHATLWRVVDIVDTLDRVFYQIQYSQTALGNLTMNSDEINLTMNAIIASFGKLSLDATLLVPYHLYAISHDRLEISTSGGATRRGKHIVSCHMRLLEIRSENPARLFSLEE